MGHASSWIHSLQPWDEGIAIFVRLCTAASLQAKNLKITNIFWWPVEIQKRVKNPTSLSPLYWWALDRVMSLYLGSKIWNYIGTIGFNSYFLELQIDSKGFLLTNWEVLQNLFSSALNGGSAGYSVANSVLWKKIRVLWGTLSIDYAVYLPRNYVKGGEEN